MPNPLHALADAAGRPARPDGRVTLPGFYDEVLPLTGAERELFARLPFDEKAWLADAGHSQATAGEAGYSTLERIWARPTAEINGMWGGHTGPGAQDHRAQPGARQGVVPAGRQPGAGRRGRGLRQYVGEHTPAGIEATVTASAGPASGRAFLADGFLGRRAGRETSMERALGTEIYSRGRAAAGRKPT